MFDPPVGVVAGLVHPRKARIEENRRFFEAHGIAVVTIVCQEADSVIEQHVHNIDHVTVVAAGSVRPTIDGVKGEVLRRGDALVIRAGVKHLFHIMEAGTVLLCITNVSGTTLEDRIVRDAPRVLPPEFSLDGVES